ncbi:MAG TPA: class III signal peptide-containing protein [archaeon]|jgi:uncharacterized protein (UPF0333 family)|nr:class III signal peptide-containing protein [archaeon]
MKRLIKDKKGQVSLEVLLIVSVIVLAAILTGYYLKQTAQKNSSKIQEYNNASTKGTQ